jgi:hypothetical protein
MNYPAGNSAWRGIGSWCQTSRSKWIVRIALLNFCKKGTERAFSFQLELHPARFTCGNFKLVLPRHAGKQSGESSQKQCLESYPELYRCAAKYLNFLSGNGTLRTRAVSLTTAYTKILCRQKPDQGGIGTSFVKRQGQGVGFLEIAVATRQKSVAKIQTCCCFMELTKPSCNYGLVTSSLIWI